MTDTQLNEIKDLILAVHRKVSNIEMAMRNPCDMCYYKRTHPKPAIPRTEPEFQPNIVLDPPPNIRVKAGSGVVERVFGTKKTGEK